MTLTFWLTEKESPFLGLMMGGAYTSRVPRAMLRGEAATMEEAAKTAAARDVMNCILKTEERTRRRGKNGGRRVGVVVVRGRGRVGPNARQTWRRI